VDDGRFEAEVQSEREWLSDKLKVPWAVMFDSNVTYVINKEGDKILRVQTASLEDDALVAAEIVAQINDRY
jgi:hypothetical protein